MAEKGKAVLVAVSCKGQSQTGWRTGDPLDELAELAGTAGISVVGRVMQALPAPVKGYYLGKGKLAQLKAMQVDMGYDTVIIDDELTPFQQQNLEELLGVKVIDRVALILDIFARHAHTREGKLQVELAQYQYLLPRLAGRWQHLERLGGGIGTRGPGESQLETDQRLIQRKIDRLKTELEAVRKHRHLYYNVRRKVRIPTVALVGYTNAGKSTLFNALSHSDVSTEDKLFATLDPTTRRICIPDSRHILITDTVGFIRKLPPSIVEAFNATLEELHEASILLHVVDISSTKAAEQHDAVDEILRDMGLSSKPLIVVLNKADLLPGLFGCRIEDSIIAGNELPSRLTDKKYRDNVVIVSALKRWGLGELKSLIARVLEDVNGS